MRLTTCLLFAFISLLSFSSNSQTGWKNWNTAQLNLSFTKKMDLKLSHLRAFNISNGFSKDFNQSSAHLKYDLTKKVDIGAGFTIGGSNTLTDGGNRLSIRAGFKSKISKALIWTNSLQAELHDKHENRYHYRVILITRLAPKKRLDFLALSPSISYSLYYNIGGSPIQYYDQKTNAPSVKQTPDGFHRGRLMLNLNSKVTTNFSLSVYCMMQREFNFLTNDFRNMNVTNPLTGKVTRKFDNYNVAGLTLSYDINFFKK